MWEWTGIVVLLETVCVMWIVREKLSGASSCMHVTGIETFGWVCFCWSRCALIKFLVSPGHLVFLVQSQMMLVTESWVICDFRILIGGLEILCTGLRIFCGGLGILEMTVMSYRRPLNDPDVISATTSFGDPKLPFWGGKTMFGDTNKLRLVVACIVCNCNWQLGICCYKT